MPKKRITLNEASSIQFSENGSIRASIDCSSIQLDESTRVGRGYQILYFEGDGSTYFHPFFGEFTFNAQVFNEFVQNFKNNVLGREIGTNYNHNVGGPASGWYQNIYTNQDGKKLLADVEWTPAASEKIRNKEYRYFSCEFYAGGFKFINPESGLEYSNVIDGGALTNIPFLSKTNITLNQPRKELSMDKDQMITALKETHHVDVVQLQSEGRTLQASLSDAQVKLTEANKKVLQLEKESKDQRMEFLYEKAFESEKTVPAHKTMFFAWLKTINLSNAEEEIEALPKIVNFSTQTGGDGGKKELDQGKDGETRSEKLHRLSTEYQKEHKCTYEVAYNAIKHQVKGE